MGAVSKFILNPEWCATEEAKDETSNSCWSLKELMDYFPEDYHRGLPEKGAWICVQLVPPTEYTVPPLSMWYALPESRPCGRAHPRKLARILTPSGSLYLEPHEYLLVEDITTFLGQEDNGVHVRFLGGQVGTALADQIFYIRSRGISRRDAELMLLGDIKRQDYCWLEVEPQYGLERNLEWPSPDRCPFAMPFPRELEAYRQEMQTRHARRKRRTPGKPFKVVLEVEGKVALEVEAEE